MDCFRELTLVYATIYHQLIDNNKLE